MHGTSEGGPGDLGALPLSTTVGSYCEPGAGLRCGFAVFTLYPLGEGAGSGYPCPQVHKTLGDLSPPLGPVTTGPQFPMY